MVIYAGMLPNNINLPVSQAARSRYQAQALHYVMDDAWVLPHCAASRLVGMRAKVCLYCRCKGTADAGRTDEYVMHVYGPDT
jgi:hypothetical protein